jgi:two-component system response regulator NreC
MSIKIALAFSNTLFSEGISKLLEQERDFSVAKAIDSCADCDIMKLESQGVTIILTDFITLYNGFAGIEAPGRKVNFILLDTNCGMENIVAAILNKKISGVLLSNAGTSLLKKAIRSVAKGEVWIDKKTFKNILHGINAIDKVKHITLSGREKEVVGLIGKGFRNKEIAQKLNISEPTVKTHLNRIFQKLSVKSRSELISYAVKNSDMASLPFYGSETS